MSAPIRPDTLAAAMAAAQAALDAASPTGTWSVTAQRQTPATPATSTRATAPAQLPLFSVPHAHSEHNVNKSAGITPTYANSAQVRRIRSRLRGQRLAAAAGAAGAAAATARAAAQLDLLGWVRPTPTPTSPCTGCPRRAGCRAPCAALLEALGGRDPDARPDAERVSRSLMGDRLHAGAGLGARLSAAEAGPWSRMLPVAEGELRAAVEGRGRWVGVLTPREREMVRLLLDGREQRELPRVLGVSREAVSARLKSARRKLGEGLGVLVASTHAGG